MTVPSPDGDQQDLRSRLTWATIRRSSPWIIVVTLVAAAGGWFWAGLDDPTWTARGVLQLSQEQSGPPQQQAQELEAQRQLLLSNSVRAELDASLGDLAVGVTNVSASITEDSALIDVAVTADTSDTALLAATQLLDSFTRQRLAERVDTLDAELQLRQAQLISQQQAVDDITARLTAATTPSERRALEIEQRNAVDELQRDENKVEELESEIALASGRVVVFDRPDAADKNQRSAPLTAAQFGVFGLIVGLGLSLALGGRGGKIRLLDEITEMLPPDIPVLATVPKFRKQFRSRENAIVIGQSDAMREAEAFRFVRTAIELATADHPTQTIAITSSTPGEGKTVTAANLALSLAASGTRTLLIDGDLISPSLPELTRRPASINTLPHLLSGEYQSQQLTTSLGTSDRVLDVLLSESLEPLNKHRVELVPESMRQILKELNSEYQALVIDCPPALLVADAVATAAAADFTIVCARVGQTRRRDFRRTVETLLQHDVPVLGVIATFVDQGDSYGYGYGYYGDDKANAGGR